MCLAHCTIARPLAPMFGCGGLLIHFSVLPSAVQHYTRSRRVDETTKTAVVYIYLLTRKARPLLCIKSPRRRFPAGHFRKRSICRSLTRHFEPISEKKHASSAKSTAHKFDRHGYILKCVNLSLLR